MVGFWGAASECCIGDTGTCPAPVGNDAEDDAACVVDLQVELSVLLILGLPNPRPWGRGSMAVVIRGFPRINAD